MLRYEGPDIIPFRPYAEESILSKPNAETHVCGIGRNQYMDEVEDDEVVQIAES